MPGPLKSSEMARKAKERLPTLAVLFTSGYTENSIVHGGRLDAGVQLLSKPYTREALARKIRQVLQTEKRQPPAAAKPDQEVPITKPFEAQPKRRRVLLVEDNPLIRMSTVDMLADLGCEVLEAGSAEEALPILEQGSVEVLITDLGLPGMSGADFCQQVRERWPSVGIVFATGSNHRPELADASRTPLLPKPHGPEELERAIEAVSVSD